MLLNHLNHVLLHVGVINKRKLNNQVKYWVIKPSFLQYHQQSYRHGFASSR